MSLSLWFRSPRYLLTLFLAIMLVLAASLSWLSWRLLKQDRALENQRIQERLDNAADLITASLLRKFSESKHQLTSLLALSDSDLAMRASDLSDQGAGTALIVVFRPQAVDAYPRPALLYHPFLPTAKSRRPVCLKPVKLQSSNRKILPKPLEFFVNCPTRRTRRSVLERSFVSVAGPLV